MYNLKNVKNTHGGVLLLVKLQAVKVILLHGCFSRFLNCRMVPNRSTHHIFVLTFLIMQENRLDKKDQANFKTYMTSQTGKQIKMIMLIIYYPISEEVKAIRQWSVTRSFYKQHFVSKATLKLVKNQPKAKQHPEAVLLLFENCLLSSSMLSSKTIMRSSETCAKNTCVCFNEIM